MTRSKSALMPLKRSALIASNSSILCRLDGIRIDVRAEQAFYPWGQRLGDESAAASDLDCIIIRPGLFMSRFQEKKGILRGHIDLLILNLQRLYRCLLESVHEIIHYFSNAGYSLRCSIGRFLWYENGSDRGVIFILLWGALGHEGFLAVMFVRTVCNCTDPQQRRISPSRQQGLSARCQPRSCPPIRLW